MPHADQTITAETANHVLWHFGRGGYQPGHFTQHLLRAATAADPTNLARLATAYPELAAAVQLAQNHDDGITQLQHIASGKLRCVRCGDEDGPWAGTPDRPLCEPCTEKSRAVA